MATFFLKNFLTLEPTIATIDRSSDCVTGSVPPKRDRPVGAVEAASVAFLRQFGNDTRVGPTIACQCRERQRRGWAPASRYPTGLRGCWVRVEPQQETVGLVPGAGVGCPKQDPGRDPTCFFLIISSGSGPARRSAATPARPLVPSPAFLMIPPGGGACRGGRYQQRMEPGSPCFICGLYVFV